MVSIASHFLRIFLVLALAVSTFGPLAAQETVTSEPSGSKPADSLIEFSNKLSPEAKDTAERNADNDPLDLPNPDFEMWEKETEDRYQEAVRAGLDYRIRGYEHRSRVFTWQLFSSRLIFVAVLLLVVGGMYFAWVQFHIGLQAQQERGERPEPTKLSASLKGVEVTSPILGVVILMISLLFFYLYLTHVYPIQEIL